MQSFSRLRMASNETAACSLWVSAAQNKKKKSTVLLKRILIKYNLIIYSLFATNRQKEQTDSLAVEDATAKET